MPLILNTAQDDDSRRLDRILRKALGRISPGFPLSAIHRLLRKGGILVDGIPCGPDYRVKAGQSIEIQSIDLPKSPVPDPQSPIPSPRSPVPPNIRYESSGLLALNKPQGLAVHGKESLEDQVFSCLAGKLPPSLSFRPGPLHRLDKPSSGIIVFSTNLEGARYFSALLREGKVCKRYLAIVDGIIEKEEVWDDLLVRDKVLKKTFTANKGSGIGDRETVGKAAQSIVSPLTKRDGRSLIQVEIKTGRTHQIRSQASSRGHPLSGDKKYGGANLPPGQKSFFLHAWSLRFTSAGGETVFIKAPVPETFRQIIVKFFGRDALRILERG